jgi:membrane-associated protease RseP (regulator of RpoE activity)
MLTAKAFGMKVSRYFAGFGPTLFSFRRGETEYGLKALPLGGFVKIDGMTPQDDDADQPRAMWRYPVWKRTIVMSAGSVTHFILGFVVLWITLFLVGVPNPALTPDQQPATVTVASCVQASDTATGCAPSDPKSPAKEAGLQDGDRITSFDGQSVGTYQDLQKAIRAAKPGPATLTYERAGQSHTAQVTLVPASRHAIDDATLSGPVSTVAALGVGWDIPKDVPVTVTYGPVESVGKSGTLAGQLFSGIGTAVTNIPKRIPNLWDALSGKPRDPNGPISVVGASRLGGESVQHGAWTLFLSFLISLNFFIGVFNLLPLLPLDGGHIVIATYERLRSRKGRVYRVDMAKVMPIFVVPLIILFTVVMGSFWLDITGR